MLSKNKISYIRSLHQKKYRDKHRVFLVEGPKMIDELLSSGFGIAEIFYVKSQFDRLKEIKNQPFDLIQISDAELCKISRLKTPNGIVAIAKQPTCKLQDLQIIDDLTLMLDGISDPGNLGTIIRTAEWFGVRNIICSENCVEVFNPKVVQATMGSVFRTKVIYANLVEFLKELKNQLPVYGAFLDGKNIYKTEFGKSGIIVVGSESHGIGPEVEKHILHRLHIPAMVSGAESLNASVAAAICISEFKRIQLKNI